MNCEAPQGRVKAADTRQRGTAILDVCRCPDNEVDAAYTSGLAALFCYGAAPGLGLYIVALLDFRGS